MDQTSRERDEAIARAKEKVAQEVEEHKAEDQDLTDVVGGWKISYDTSSSSSSGLEE